MSSHTLAGWDDTIVGISTAPGLGAIAVIRISGPDALNIADLMCPSRNLLNQPTHTLHLGMLMNGEEMIDEVVISLFHGPKSYTGEHVVEISCHGSPFVQEQVLQACIQQGARLAKPGEFTQRAFLNGKLDLTQAEAVADLINSNTKASQKNALHNLRGGFKQILKSLREELVKFSALIELELDFAMEDVEFADRKKFYEIIDNAQGTTQQLLDSFRLGNAIKHGISVAIIGKPNAGKSTLLNTLLNEDRAIVSEIAGTTRDTIEEMINIKGILFRLIDTAGIRDHSTDTIEMTGIARSMEKMKSADVVLYIFDVNNETSEAIREQVKTFTTAGINFMLVGNKADLSSDATAREKFTGIENIYFISAKDKVGIEPLKNGLFESTVQDAQGAEGTIISNTRHHAALQKVGESLAAIRNGLDQAVPGDLLALDIRHCLHYVSEITGDITNEDVLDFIFSKFCIGK